ncbi:MAG TPA: PAS domain S-box protein [Desulfuromonadales bacterium]|nr:PAS domain S-box protein [Desulfuromonadales bacterium]
MSNFSLKTKVTFIFPLTIVIALALLLFAINSFLRNYIKDTISEQQQQIVALLVEQIDQKMLATQQPLISLATKISPEHISNPDEALAFLLEGTDFINLFDNGLFLFDRSGRIIAELPLGTTRNGRDFSSRDYLQATFSTRAPYISDPYISSQDHHHPAIMFTVPILDASGSVQAVLGGSIDLTKNNFLGKLSSSKIGKKGYLFLFDTNRVMISHPDPTRVMKKDIPPGANRLLDRSIEGFDGTGETVNSRNLKTLTTFMHLKSKNWIIGANFPLAEVYSPLYRQAMLFYFLLPLFLVTMFLFMRRYLNNITTPISALANHVATLSEKTGDERLLPATTLNDEIATLGQIFNELIRETDRHRDVLQDELKRREEADSRLHQKNEYLTALHETTVGLISRHDVASLLQAIVTRAGNLIGTEHCFVYLKDASGNEMNMLYQSGIYNSLVHYPIVPGLGIVGRVWMTGEPFRVEDYSVWENRIKDPQREVLHAMAGVPLKSGDEIIGVLGLAFVDREVVFNDEQMELLDRFGELASLALENARLNDESQRELSERKRVEENLRKLSVAVEQNPASIVITDTSGTIEYINPHFTELTGYTAAEAIGQNPRILKTGETSSAEYQQLWKTILAGGEWRGEFHNRKKDGDLYWEQALIAPIRDEHGNISHFIAIKEDITERKQLEGQLRHSQKMEAVGQLAGGIAHDFNNILTAIIGYATILQVKLPENSPLIRTTEQIASTAERGASLTQGLLAFSRKQSSNPVIMDLNEILNRVHQLLLRLISEDIRLEINLSALPLPVMADSGQMEQVLMNLATNARDAQPKGGSIVISTEMATLNSDFVLARGFGQPGRYALMSFTDNGDGMDAETVKHIFEPFYTTKELGKGTGLGLSIVYGIIKKHNGFILCHSTIGIGTIFHVYLPLLEEAPPSENKLPENAIPEYTGNDVVLIAEDNDTTRTLTREILQEFGYIVIEAFDGEDALEKFRQQSTQIRLVILDVIMPKMNGREVYDEIRKVDSYKQVLFCSGYARDVVLQQGVLEEGMNYLPKPFTPKELLMKIREVLADAE